MDHNRAIERWEKVGSEYLGDFRIFRIGADRSRSPRTGILHRFFVLESPDWVNVNPLTPEGNVVMIRQFRHGTEDVTLEVPGGMVDAEDGYPSVSAARELREETGYEAEEVIRLVSVAPNPAFLNNRCHSFLGIFAYPPMRFNPEFKSQRLEGDSSRSGSGRRWTLRDRTPSSVS